MICKRLHPVAKQRPSSIACKLKPYEIPSQVFHSCYRAGTATQKLEFVQVCRLADKSRAPAFLSRLSSMFIIIYLLL